MDDPIFLPEPEPEAAEGAGISAKLWETISAHRKDVLAALQKIPSLLSAADKLVSNGNRYRAIVSKGNLHLLRERADGITKPWLRNARGHFVENVDLVRIPPDIAGAFATIAIQAALSQLSVKLDEVVRGVGDLAKLVAKANQGRVQGAIDAVEVARSLRDEKERRTLMLVACGNVLTELGTLAGQMDAHIAQMPPVETGFRDGWDGNGLTQAGAGANSRPSRLRSHRRWAAASSQRLFRTRRVRSCARCIFENLRSSGQCGHSDRRRSVTSAPVPQRRTGAGTCLRGILTGHSDCRGATWSAGRWRNSRDRIRVQRRAGYPVISQNTIDHRPLCNCGRPLRPNEAQCPHCARVSAARWKTPTKWVASSVSTMAITSVLAIVTKGAVKPRA
jgi:hypothetical protein